MTSSPAVARPGLLRACSKCGAVKGLNDFYRHHSCADGYRGTCKACHSEECERARKVRRAKMPKRMRRLPQDADRQSVIAALFARVLERDAPGAPDACWEWPHGRTVAGYGQVQAMGHRGAVHRVSYEAHHGVLADDLMVCHRCDNPPCWNPAHLFPGTHDDNMLDRTRKGRNPMGESHANAKLTTAAIRQIRASAEPMVRLAERYGVSWMTIKRIRRRITWAHVA